MVPERDIDSAALYDHERLAVVGFVRSLAPEQLAVTVPATPAWTVRDVLAHVVAITTDLNAQRFGDAADDPEAWTARQIEERRDLTVDDLAAEWEREAPAFVEGLRLFGYEFGAHYLGDLMQHHGDVRQAVGVSPVRADLALTVALDFYLSSFEETLVELGVGAVEVIARDPVGTDRRTGEDFVLGEGEVLGAVRVPRWELFRALGGRRTLVEIRSLDWLGDAVRLAPVIEAMSRYPVPEVSLGER